ncbi:MAG: uroporphyrinogen decarboxylase family protein [Promethearchaeota archaeon]
MNARQRFLSIFGDETPDRVPRFVQHVKEDFFTLNEDVMFENYAGDLVYNTALDGPLVLGFDACFVHVPASVRCTPVEVEDDDGVKHHVGTSGQIARKDTSYYTGGVLTTQERHDSVWENVEVFDNSKAIREQAEWFESVQDKIFPVPAVGGIFDVIWQSMGFAAFSREYRKRSKFYLNLVRDYAELVLRNIEGVIRATGDRFGVITVLDDVAFKGRPMISPERFERDFVPYYKKITDAIHDAGLHAMLHSDGDVTSIVPALKRAGFEGVQGWEGGADPFEVADKYPEFAVVGFGDVSEVLPFGTLEQVDAHVRELMDALKGNGHFCIGPSTVIVKEMPYENVAQFVRSSEKYGKY